MSREIKFRAWDNANNEWLNKADSEQLAMHLDGSYGLDRGWIIAKPDLTIEQYTGLKDKNGKEIYEGDIILAFGFCRKYAVEWSEKYAAFETIDLIDGEMGPSIEFTAKYATVIGNIHENPELLEDKKDDNN